MAAEDAPLFSLDKTPDEEQAELTAAAAPLVAFAFPAAIFNRTNAINAGFSFKSFLKHVQSVARYAENDQLPAIVGIGVKNNIFDTHVVCTLAQFIKLSRFLKSKEGVDALIGVTKRAKLEKRAQGVFEASDVALESLFQIQRQDYAQCTKAEMLEYQKRIADLRVEIRRLEQRMEARKQEIDHAFVPASIQADIDEEELNNQGALQRPGPSKGDEDPEPSPRRSGVCYH